MPFPVAAALGVAGSLVSAFGSSSEGSARAAALRAENEAAKEQAKEYRKQAEFATESAEIARGLARAEAVQVDRQNRLRLGAIRAAAGAAGGRQMGSVQDILGDVATQGELARQNALFQGFLKARSEEETARRFTAQAALQEKHGVAAMRAAGAAQRAGTIGAASALLGGLGSVLGAIMK